MRLPGEVTVLGHTREGAEAEKRLMPGRRNAPVSTQGENFSSISVRQAPLQAIRVINRSGTAFFRLRC